MPETPLFLTTFDLAEGMVFGNYKLTSIDIGHHVFEGKRWNEYAYPMTLTLKWQNKTKPSKEDVDNMVVTFTKHVSRARVAQVPSGRFYKCVFIFPIGEKIEVNKIDGNNEVYLKCTGHAKRISASAAEEVRQTGRWNAE